ncbi:NUDIX hydrolase [Vibrio splendidus]|nr:NUDIX hydrolase [Vibrio splendidus]MCC4881456.1 NUDIX hydrolase [Vibrio splendidus]
MNENKKLSCGVIIVDKDNKILMQHVTGQRHWDIPKGTQDIGESTRETALRELKEETGLVAEAHNLIDVGLCQYNRFKDLYLFMLFVDHIDISTLECKSVFIDDLEYEVPEADYFEMVGLYDMKKRACRSMANLLDFKLEREIEIMIARRGA